MLSGLLPALGRTQSRYSFDNITAGNPSLSFFNRDKGEFTVIWDLKTMELVVKTDGREARISQKEIMDALEKPQALDYYMSPPHVSLSPDGKKMFWAR